MPVSRRVSVLCQYREILGNRYSMCGLLSINNSLQRRDFLTPAAMKPILAKLALVRPNEDHDHPSYGAYTMDALQKGLQKRRKQLWFLNVKARFKRRARGPASVIRSRRPAHL
ncbi:hypothetical protein F442_08544, partial [Phytophthora nicotianae P10297]